MIYFKILSLCLYLTCSRHSGNVSFLTKIILLYPKLQVKKKNKESVALLSVHNQTSC